MRVKTAKELFRQITKVYFNEANVIFAQQSRVAKPKLNLVVITPGVIRRPYMANYGASKEELIGSYETRMSIIVDYFSKGTPITDASTDAVVAYDNTAMDEMIGFANYLNSKYVTDWCYMNDVAITIDDDAQDLTGIVNDNNYEYRARLSVQFYFTQRAVGQAAIGSVEEDDVIRYPVPLEEILPLDNETGWFETAEIEEEEQ